MKLVNLFKNIYYSRLFLVTTVSPNVNVQTGFSKAVKGICNFSALLVLVRLTLVFWQIFLALFSAVV